MLLSFVFILVLNNSFVHALRTHQKEAKECLFALKDIPKDDICPSYQQLLDKVEILSKRISKWEDWFQKFPFLNDAQEPLNEFDRIFANKLIALYSFEQNALDSSGNSHNGNAIGGVTYE